MHVHGGSRRVGDDRFRSITATRESTLRTTVARIQPRSKAHRARVASSQALQPRRKTGSRRWMSSSKVWRCSQTRMLAMTQPGVIIAELPALWLPALTALPLLHVLGSMLLDADCASFARQVAPSPCGCGARRQRVGELACLSALCMLAQRYQCSAAPQHPEQRPSTRRRACQILSSASVTFCWNRTMSGLASCLAAFTSANPVFPAASLTVTRRRAHRQR